MNAKQILRSYQRGYNALRRTQLKFFLLFTLVWIIVFAVGAILDPVHAHACTLGLGGSSFAGLVGVAAVADVSDANTSGNNLSAQVVLIPLNQIDGSVAFPKPNAAREVSTLPMLAGQYMTLFEAHDIPEYLGKNEKGDMTTTGTKTFTFNMGGVRDVLMDFVEQYAGCKFIIIFKEIESTTWEILGSYDRPIVLKSTEVKNNKDGRYAALTFERSSVKEYFHYTGAIVTAPAANHAADGATLAITSAQSQYNIPDGSAATYALTGVSGVTASDKGRIVTLYGTGASKAATIGDNTAFILEDAATWTAKAGSRISFRILDANTLVEISGSRVQTA